MKIVIQLGTFIENFCKFYFVIHSYFAKALQLVGCLSNGDTFGAIQSVIISEVILYIICAFGTNESVLIREVSLLRGPPTLITKIRYH